MFPDLPVSLKVCRKCEGILLLTEWILEDPVRYAQEDEKVVVRDVTNSLKKIILYYLIWKKVLGFCARLYYNCNTEPQNNIGNYLAQNPKPLNPKPFGPCITVCRLPLRLHVPM